MTSRSIAAAGSFLVVALLFAAWATWKQHASQLATSAVPGASVSHADASRQEQLAAMDARLAALERGGQSASLPLGLPLVGGLAVVGLLFAARGRRLL